MVLRGYQTPRRFTLHCMDSDRMVIFIIIILLYHPEIMPSNSQFISKLSSYYTWPILNDKLSIRHNVLTMCLSPVKVEDLTFVPALDS